MPGGSWRAWEGLFPLFQQLQPCTVTHAPHLLSFLPARKQIFQDPERSIGIQHRDPPFLLLGKSQPARPPAAVPELISPEQGSSPVSRLRVPLADGAGKVSLKDNTCTWWFRSPPSSSLPACLSLGRSSCSQLPAKPVLLFLAPAPSLSEPANGEGKKAASQLVAEKFPSCGIAAGTAQPEASLLGETDGPHGARLGRSSHISQGM